MDGEGRQPAILNRGTKEKINHILAAPNKPKVAIGNMDNIPYTRGVPTDLTEGGNPRGKPLVD